MCRYDLSAGGHVNPAITLTMAVIGKLKWYKVPIYWSAQYIGAFLAAPTVYLLYIGRFTD